MTCGYCFAGEGDTTEKGSYELRDRQACAGLAHRKLRHPAQSGSGFLGGEPLLNFDVVKKLVAYGRSREKECNKNFRFTLTTNGMLLNDEVIEFANKEMSNVVISLDGRKSVNDNMRKTHEGGGTYDAILPCASRKLAESRNQQNYYVRGTYTHYNTDFASDIIHMADLGFKELSIEPVVAPPEAPYALQESDIPKLLSEYDTTGNGNAGTKTGRQGTRLHFLSLHDRPDRRRLHRQTDLRLRRGNGIRCGDPVRRPVPVPSVRR